METPVTSRATPPSHEKPGEEARRRLFASPVSPRSRASAKKIVRELNFSSESEPSCLFATSTPAPANVTITLSSSPWELQGPRAVEVSNASTPGWRDQLLADLHRPNSPMSQDSMTPDPSPLPPQVRHVLRGNLERPVKVVVTKFTTYEIIPQ